MLGNEMEWQLGFLCVILCSFLVMSVHAVMLTNVCV